MTAGTEMRLRFDDIIFSLQPAGGISRFWSKIVARHRDDDTARFIHAPPIANLHAVAPRLVLQQPDRPLPLAVRRYLTVPRSSQTARYVFHSSYYRVDRSAGALNVVTVHDMIYEVFDKGPRRLIHMAQKNAALRHAYCIVCVSEHTRDDLLHWYPACAGKRIEIIGNGVDPASSHMSLQDAEPQATAGYFLYVGHRGACKGFPAVFTLLDSLPNLRCVVVGAPFDAEEVSMIKRERSGDRIVAAGRVSDPELSSLYRNADFFFFPSLYEGFGIPPLEAMLNGCPVLASDRSSIPEVVGDAAILFDPDRPETMIDGARRIKGPIADDLRARGIRRAAQKSWTAAIDRYETLYADLLAEARR